jgi:hypothetical protein
LTGKRANIFGKKPAGLRFVPADATTGNAILIHPDQKASKNKSRVLLFDEHRLSTRIIKGVSP